MVIYDFLPCKTLLKNTCCSKIPHVIYLNNSIILLQDTTDNERTKNVWWHHFEFTDKVQWDLNGNMTDLNLLTNQTFILQSNKTDIDFMNTLYFVLPRVTLKELPVWWTDLLRREVHFYTSSFIDLESLASIWIFYVRDACA